MGWRTILPACCILAGTGCGYSVNPSSGSGHHSIAIPVLENATEPREYGLEELTTRILVDTFLEDNRLEVVSPDDAETILRGTVSDYKNTPYTYDEKEQVQEYRVEMTLDLEYVVVESGKTVWHDPNFFVWAAYRPGASEGDAVAADEDAAKEEAAKKLAGEVVARTIEGW